MKSCPLRKIMKNQDNSPCKVNMRNCVLCAIVTGSVVLVACSFHVNRCELQWKRNWMELAHKRTQAMEEVATYELQKSFEGEEYDTMDFRRLSEQVHAYSNGKNTLCYVGTKGGFDYLIHYTAAITHRVKMSQGPALKVERFPLTDDPTRWCRLKLDDAAKVLTPSNNTLNENNAIFPRYGITPLRKCE